MCTGRNEPVRVMLEETTRLASEELTHRKPVWPYSPMFLWPVDGKAPLMNAISVIPQLS